jgi:hypothetical protein
MAFQAPEGDLGDAAGRVLHEDDPGKVELLHGDPVHLPGLLAS